MRVDRLARRLGLTKGSFHHHFRGVGDYQRALLERHERDQAAALDRLIEELSEVSPSQALTMLPARVASQIDNDLERAVRAWSVNDPGVRAVQERLDDSRLGFLTQVWAQILGDECRAHTAALVPHLIAVGASVAHPRLGATELTAVYELLAELAQGVDRNERLRSDSNRGELHEQG